MGEHYVNLETLADIKKDLVILSGTYCYWYRIPNVSADRMNVRLSELEGFKDQTGLLPYFREEFDAELKDYQTYSQETDSRYVGDFGCNYLMHDRFEALEQVGVMQYSKKCSVLYTLYDKLDYAIAYMFNTPLEDVRKNLRKNCEEYKIDYLKLSYAFCSKNHKLLETINLGCLVNVSPTLDAALLRIIDGAEACKVCIGGYPIDLAGDNMSIEDKVTSYIFAKVSYFIHLILNVVLEEFAKGKDGLVCCSSRIPVSVGRCSIIVASTDYNLPEIVINVRDVFTLRLSVRTYKSLGVRYEGNWYNTSNE